MNKTKRTILIIVIILNFINAGLNIYFIIDAFKAMPLNDMGIVYLIYDFISLLGFLASAGCLLYAISGGGRNWQRRNGYYMSAVIISLCMSLFSVSSVLLVVSLFMSDMVWVRPQDDVYFNVEDVNAPKKEPELSESERQRKILKLRELRDKGVIDEEEFKQELMKLL